MRLKRSRRFGIPSFGPALALLMSVSCGADFDDTTPSDEPFRDEDLAADELRETQQGLSLGAVLQARTVPCTRSAPGGICKLVDVACPQADTVQAMIRILSPPSPRGTVLFTSGLGGRGFYSVSYRYGGRLMDDVAAAGFTAVEIRWQNPDGWIAGTSGPKRLACRYATVANGIYNAVHVGGAAAPFCATGTSGGASQVVYSLSHYGLGAIFDMVEVTSGPPHARIDYGCLCQTRPIIATPCGDLPSLCYNSASTLFDASYGQPWCTDRDASKLSLFQSDSILSGNQSYPSTYVRLLLGEEDRGSAASQAMHWFSAVTTRKDTECVEGAGHPIADTFEGYTKLRSDIVTSCRLTQ